MEMHYVSPTVRVVYDVVDERIVILREDGSVERLTAFQVRQRALWRDGKPQVAEVLGLREVPVET